jgi:polyphosphate kinase
MGKKNSNNYINREISWLSFNERVMQEAADRSVPLIDRLKFLGIYSSNLDEFFSVRVGTLRRMIKAGIKSKSFIGDRPNIVLKQVQAIVLRQRDLFDRIFNELLNELEKEDIYIINEKGLDPEHEAFIQNYFKMEVHPRLVPIMLNNQSSFPYLKSAAVYLAIHLSNSVRIEDIAYALIEIPAKLIPRFVVLPKLDGKKYIIMLDDIIRYGLREIFDIFDFDQLEAYTIKLTRDAELDIDDDVTKSYFEKVSESIRARQLGQPVRFVYDREIPDDLLEFILRKNKLENFENLIPGGRYHNARDFMSFPKIGSSNLTYKKKPFLNHKHLVNKKSIFAAMKEKDILLHYPYQSFHYIIDLLREAAIDPQVKSIKMSLYRLARDSNVINALRNACRNGKEVTTVIELQARFDEEANIRWTKKLEEENARIIDGVPGLKVHAKICLITRIEDGKKFHYAVVGTGNYNESTATIYSDHSLLTADPRITGEVNKLFKFLENNYKTYNYKHLLVSPFLMRSKYYKMIQAEIQNAKSGKPAYIYAKMNSLVDRNMIQKLYQASKAGVQIRLIVRGICSLVPGVPGLSENIEAISILDKYLEHSRIFIFCNDGNEKIYISSADWMIRNLDNRVEAAVPIYDPDIRHELRDFFEIQWKDNTKARIFNIKQDNLYREKTGNKQYRTQEDLYNYLKDQLS